MVGGDPPKGRTGWAPRGTVALMVVTRFLLLMCSRHDSMAASTDDAGADDVDVDVLAVIMDRDVVIQVLKWARQHGCPWEDQRDLDANSAEWLDDTLSTVGAAAVGGHFDCFTFAVEYGAPRTWRVLRSAARNGNLEILEWAMSHGMQFESREELFEEEEEWAEIADDMAEDEDYEDEMAAAFVFEAGSCAAAARGGHKEVLRFLGVQGVPRNWRTLRAAVRGGHLELAKWLRDRQGCAFEDVEEFDDPDSRFIPGEEMTCAAAAFNADLPMLKWLLASGCVVDPEICRDALEDLRRGNTLGGPLDQAVVEWLDEIPEPVF